jgi:hypothetical protein
MEQWRPWFGTMVVALAACPAGAQTGSVEELRRELATVKRQLEEMQATIRRQQELIEKLVGEKPPPPAVPPAAAAAPAAPPAPAVAEAKPPWSPAQPLSLLRSGGAYMNVSFDALIDFGWSTTPDVTTFETGDHDPLQRGFTLPNEEIFFDGGVDPYFKGVADIVFKLDENNETEVELEEVYLTTTHLPWNLQAKAGQFFTEFGRINQQHPHAWDFVDQPLVIGRMFGPEGLRNPGARLSWLAPTPFYAEAFVTMQNSQGTTAYSFRNAETELFGRPPLDRSVRTLGDLLYVPRLVASFDVTDSQTLVAGVSGAFGPNDSGPDSRTQIYGGDLYWKWKPPWQAGGFPFVALQTEALGRRYEAGPGAGEPALPSEVFEDWGIYAQALYGFTPRWVAGARVDHVSGQRQTFPVDERLGRRIRYSPNLTFYPTEFSKIRLQYNYDDGRQIGTASSVWLQLEFLLGAHAAHKL